MCKRECLMFFDDAQQHPSESDTPESGIRFAMMVVELWHDWFEAMSEVAYQTHRACEFFVQHGGDEKWYEGGHPADDAHNLNAMGFDDDRGCDEVHVGTLRL